MELRNWKHIISDLADAEDFCINPNLSPLANGVDYLNITNAKSFPNSIAVLEVGCGSQSVLKDNLNNGIAWDGIDVLSVSPSGRPTIATKLASVANIPFEDRVFDVVYSNQSIEHWYEYGVSLSVGLGEINRVLNLGGKAIINFPVHLHGHRFFVRGNFEAIEKAFLNCGFEIVKRTAVIDSKLPNYNGWRLCGFPDFYISKQRNYEKTSYVVEYEAEKIRELIDLPKTSVVTTKKMSGLGRALHHGYSFLIWKIVNKISSKLRPK